MIDKGVLARAQKPLKNLLRLGYRSCSAARHPDDSAFAGLGHAADVSNLELWRVSASAGAQCDAAIQPRDHAGIRLSVERQPLRSSPSCLAILHDITIAPSLLGTFLLIGFF